MSTAVHVLAGTSLFTGFARPPPNGSMAERAAAVADEPSPPFWPKHTTLLRALSLRVLPRRVGDFAGVEATGADGVDERNGTLTRPPDECAHLNAHI